MFTIKIIFIFILSSAAAKAQLATADDFRENRQIEQKLVKDKRIAKIEVTQYLKGWPGNGDKMVPAGRSIYEYDVNGLLIRRSITSFDRNGHESILWKGRYVYNAAGICDSVPTDTGVMRKAVSPGDLYPACYVHQGHQKLQDGLVQIIHYPKKQGGGKTKLVYTFISG